MNNKEPDNYCLKDLNIEVEQNELLAVIGSVGSGKVWVLILNTTKFLTITYSLSIYF